MMADHLDDVAVKPTKKRDERLNEHGVFVRGTTTLKVKVPKALGTECDVKCVEVSPGDWRAAVSVVGPMGTFGASIEPLKIESKSYPTMVDAVEAAVGRAAKQAEKATDKKAGGKLAGAVRSWFRAWMVHVEFCPNGNGHATILEPGMTSTTTPGGIALAELREWCRGLSPADLERMTEAESSAVKLCSQLPSVSFTCTEIVAKVHRRFTEFRDAAEIEAATPIATPTVGGLQIDVDSIEWHPANPRQDFDLAELTSLADTMDRIGTLQPIVVRRHPAPSAANIEWQGLAGERRWRAARLRHHEKIAATVRDVDDATALDIVVTENFARKDLSPIEEARAVQTLTKKLEDGGAGLTQKQVAERYGHKQSWAANLLRLLELPAAIQAKVTAGELDQAKARALVPFAKHPALFEKIEQDMRDDPHPWQGNREDFEWELGCSVRSHTEEVSKDQLKKLTDEEKAALQVVDLSVPGYAGPSKETRALNVEAFRQRFPRPVYSSQPASKGKNKSTSPGPLTDAQKKAKAREAKKALAERIARWRLRWLRWTIARGRYGWAIDESQSASCAALLPLDTKLLLWAGCTLKYEFAERMRAAVRAIGGATQGNNSWKTLTQAARGEDDVRLAHALLYYVLWPSYQPRLVGPPHAPADMSADMVDAIVAEAELDVEHAWSELVRSEEDPEADALFLEFLELHTKDQLHAQATAWDVVDVVECESKADLVKACTGEFTILSLPACLAPAKPAKKGRKKGGKR